MTLLQKAHIYHEAIEDIEDAVGELQYLQYLHGDFSLLAAES